MKDHAILESLILAIIFCMITRAGTAAAIPCTSILWNAILAPAAMCGTRIVKAWTQVSLDPLKYQLREPYNSIDILRHPYFHNSLNLTVFERYILITFKHAGFLALFNGTVQVLGRVTTGVRIRSMAPASTEEHVKTVGCSPGRVPHGLVFWVSSFFTPTLPLLAHGSTSIWSHNCRPSESEVEHEIFFWLSTLFEPTFPPWMQDQRETRPSNIHPPKHTAKDTAEITLPAEMDPSLVSPMLEEVNPFESPLVSDKFRPLATSSARGSSMRLNTSDSYDLSAVLKADRSMEREEFYDVVNSPGFLGYEDSMGTLVHLLSDGSPVPRCFSVSRTSIDNIGAISNTKNMLSTSASCSAVVTAPVKDNVGSAETAVLPHSQSPASLACDSCSQVSGPRVSFPQTSCSNREGRQAIALPASEELLLDATNVEARVELNHGPRTHICSLSVSNITHTYTFKKVSTGPPKLLGAAVRASPLLNAPAKEKSLGSPSFFPPADVLKAPTEKVYIKKVGRKVVVKTRLFEDAFKRATTGLLPERKRY